MDSTRGYSRHPELAEEHGTAIAGEAQAEAAKADVLPAAGGPGRESDPLVKLAIERYAEDRAREWLEGQGWVCKRIGAPFDLRCTKGDRELHAEVKGTRGKGKVVKLTRNEVLHNQESCTWETKCDAQALSSSPGSRSLALRHRTARWDTRGPGR